MKRLSIALALAALCAQSIANTCVPIQAGATDQTVYVTFLDASTGVPTAGLLYNSSGIDLEYVRTAAAAVDITEATQTASGAHSDGGFVSVGHGRYRLDLPDAAVATGATQVVIQGTITGYVLAPCTIALSPPVNVVSFGGTAGTFSSGRPEVNTSHWGGTAVASATVNANATQISGDSGAADALENWMDGTAGAVPYTGITDRGTLQAVDGDSATLRSAAAFGTDILNGSTIVITSGTDAGLRGLITDDEGTADTYNVTWSGGVTPSGTPTYEIWATAEGSGGGGGSLTAADVWSYSTRRLTELDEDNTTIDLNGSTIGTVATLTNAPSDSSGITTLLSRLTSTRAGYLDNLSAGAVATQSSVNTIDDFVDTEVAAIKAKTDQLTFTVAGEVDANIESQNGAELCGDGSSGDKWRACP